MSCFVTTSLWLMLFCRCCLFASTDRFSEDKLCFGDNYIMRPLHMDIVRVKFGMMMFYFILQNIFEAVFLC